MSVLNIVIHANTQVRMGGLLGFLCVYLLRFGHLKNVIGTNADEDIAERIFSCMGESLQDVSHGGA